MTTEIWELLELIWYTMPSEIYTLYTIYINTIYITNI